MTVTQSVGINAGVLEEIRVAMARRRINQSALARMMDVNTFWVSRRMRGETPLTLDDLSAIADALETTVVELLPPHVVFIGPDPSAAARGMAGEPGLGIRGSSQYLTVAA